MFKDNEAFNAVDAIWFVEDELFFTQHKYHQQKLVLHRASMKAYLDSFDGRSFDLEYYDNKSLEGSVFILEQAKKAGFEQIQIFYVSDYLLEKRINQWASANSDVKIKWLESPLFINKRNELAKYFNNDKKSFRMEDWYRSERKKRNILMNDGNPVGREWNYDHQNRDKLPKNHAVPDNPSTNKNNYITEAIEYVAENFAVHPGDADRFWYPATHDDAEKWFENFLHVRFKDFGPYEDAIKANSESVLYHSVLSPLINIGLLEVKNVVDRILRYAEQDEIPINSTEGLIRQLIGWREFMHGLYLHRGVQMRQSNFFNHTRDVPAVFWSSGIEIDPIDNVISRALNTAYAHHIERLMVVSNYCVLAEFNPDHVYGWFMELFIDAYDWVMVPNVYSMSLFADGGIMATKPYISSSNYLDKMSDYKRDKDNPDHWSAKWDALYWRFMHKHRDFMESNARLSRVTSHLDRMNDLNDKLELAQSELARLSKMDSYYGTGYKALKQSS